MERAIENELSETEVDIGEAIGCVYTQIHRERPNGQCLLHCHTNMTPGSNGIQYWFEICNQIDGEFPMNRDNIIYIYGEDGDIRMTDANVIRLAFHILFHFAMCTGPVFVYFVIRWTLLHP